MHQRRRDPGPTRPDFVPAHNAPPAIGTYEIMISASVKSRHSAVTVHRQSAHHDVESHLDFLPCSGRSGRFRDYRGLGRSPRPGSGFHRTWFSVLRTRLLPAAILLPAAVLLFPAARLLRAPAPDVLYAPSPSRPAGRHKVRRCSVLLRGSLRVPDGAPHRLEREVLLPGQQWSEGLGIRELTPSRRLNRLRLDAATVRAIALSTAQFSMRARQSRYLCASVPLFGSVSV
jgi:hypothetical protein